jgi:EmrB/QacA subfamily drug resistance transporter
MDDAKVHDRRWWALGVMVMSLLIISLDNTILNVAIPSLVRDLGATTSSLQWIVDGYTLVFAGLLLTTGSLGDRFGRKGALQLGMVLFGIGSAASAVAPSATVLIFTRSFMGIGAALIMPATLSLLTNVFHDPQERAFAISIWAAVASAGAAVGPVLGGFLLAHFWWGSVFLVNVPVAAIAVLLGRPLLPTSRDPDTPDLDPVGAILSVVGLVAVLWAVIQAPTVGWGDTKVIAALLGGLVVIGGFILWELGYHSPMLDIRFFRNRRFSAANLAITLTMFAMFGASFLITQYVQTVLGYSALEAGIRLAPMALAISFLSPRSPKLVERYGTKAVVGTGLAMAAGGLVFTAFVPVHDGYWHLLAGMLVLAIGIGIVMAPATESIMGSLPKNKAGVGSAMNDTTRQMGGALGVAVIGSIVASGYRPAIDRHFGELGASHHVVGLARDSVGGAFDAVRGAAQPLRGLLEEAARQDFVSSFRVAFLISALVLAIAAAVAWMWLPAWAVDYDDELLQEEAGAADGLASLTFAEAEGALVAARDEERADRAEPRADRTEPPAHRAGRTDRTELADEGAT